MFTIRSAAAFDSAHFLAGYPGKCANLHGHHWVVEVEAAQADIQETGEKRGMVLDFSDLKKALRALAEELDHAMLYEAGSLRETTVQALQAEQFRLVALPFRPTAELLAKYFHEQLAAQGIPVQRVTVYETPENAASYEVQP